MQIHVSYHVNIFSVPSCNNSVTAGLQMRCNRPGKVDNVYANTVSWLCSNFIVNIKLPKNGTILKFVGQRFHKLCKMKIQS